MNLKVLTICALTLLVSGRAPAQVRVEQSPQMSRPSMYAKDIRKYKRMASIGSILTVVGSGLFIGGVMSIEKSNDIPQEHDGSSPPKGFYRAVAGMACIGPGVPMSIVGIRKCKKFKRLESLTVKLSATPQYQGLTLNYKL